MRDAHVVRPFPGPIILTGHDRRASTPARRARRLRPRRALASGSTSTGASTSGGCRSTAAGERDRAWAGAADRLHPRPGGLLGELAGATAALRPRASCHRDGPARLRALADARREDLDLRLRRASSTSCSTRSASSAPRWSATRWAASSARAGHPLPRPASSGWCSSARRASRSSTSATSLCSRARRGSRTSWSPAPAGWPRARTASPGARARGGRSCGSSPTGPSPARRADRRAGPWLGQARLRRPRSTR